MKKMIACFLMGLMLFSNDFISKAQNLSDEIYVQDVTVDDLYYDDAVNLEESKINRAASTNVSGGKNNWGTVLGDNNKIGETVKVYNCSGKPIVMKAYTEKGTQRASAIIQPGEFARAGFWIADGRYYFKLQFQDYSSGTITIRMETEWI